ncbi:MAG: helix-turn-helix domain-containing protein [Porticoccaceae bacterium]
MAMKDNNRSLAWKTAFPGLVDNEPGVYLAGARHREGLTQHQLAKQSGIPQRHISEMENGKRTIGKENAKKTGCGAGRRLPGVFVAHDFRHG